MALQWIDCEQGSPEWFAARCGAITASRFSDVLAQGKGLTRAKYMRELAGEIITGTPADSYSNAHMERGKEMEAEARAAYEFQFNDTARLVGFARNGRVGCSPDAMLEKGGPLELKTKLPHLLIECIERDDLPPEHKAQVQGALWITGAECGVFCAYWPGMPLFAKVVARDAYYIANLEGEVARFTDELDAMVERIRAYRCVA